MTARAMTEGERAIARSVFGRAIDLDRVEIRRRKWWPLHPRNVVMAPCGHLHFHPHDGLWREDYARESLSLRGLFVHELVHVWQHQRGLFLPLRRHPFCRYAYALHPGRPLDRYGIEQQGEIVRHAFLLREGARVPGAPPLDQYESLLAIFAGY